MSNLRGGSSVALVKSTCMITTLLVEYRAYDFADQWDGLVEEVLGELLGSPAAHDTEFEARLRRETLDGLSDYLRAKTEWDNDGELPWCESSRMGERWAPMRNRDVATYEVEVGKLPEQRSQVIRDVYGQGRSFDQVAAERKLPLRMVKRFLRESIWDLRERCSQANGPPRDNADQRVKSCFKSLGLDLPAFLVEPHLDAWSEFRAHYPVCLDCSVVVSNWSAVELLVRAACDGTHRHPSADELIALHRDGEGLAYSQYVLLMRHLDGCPPCGEAMTLLARYDGRSFAQALIKKASEGRRGAASSRKPQSRLALVVARARAILGL
jgi:DNA-directed RNA polymerase specialized sigma24 family protein